MNEYDTHCYPFGCYTDMTKHWYDEIGTSKRYSTPFNKREEKDHSTIFGVERIFDPIFL